MTTETILTDGDIRRIWNNALVFYEFARAIEQAVLQSPEVQSMRDDGFTDGVLLALQMITANGDAGSHLHTELIETAGLECVVRRAAQEGMTEAAGLNTPMSENVRAKIDAAMEQKS